MFRITINLKPLRSYGSLPFSYNQNKKLSLLGRFEERFTTSNLVFEKMQAIHGRIHPQGSVKFTASFMTKLEYQDVYNCLYEKEFAIGDSESMLQYLITEVVRQVDPEIKTTMRYGTLSPILVRRKQGNGNDLYLMPGDREFNDMFFEHAYYKYLDFTGQRLDVSKCSYKQEGRLNTKLITVTMNNTPIQIRTFVQSFTVTAPAEIHKVLIYTGAGAANSLGLGCVEVSNRY